MHFQSFSKNPTACLYDEEHNDYDDEDKSEYAYDEVYEDEESVLECD